MKYKLLDLFMEEFDAEHSDVQMTIMSKTNNKMIKVVFRAEAMIVRQWLAEIIGEVVFVEVRKLYDTLSIMTYGVPYNGEIHEFERNSLEIEMEYLSYDE